MEPCGLICAFNKVSYNGTSKVGCGFGCVMGGTPFILSHYIMARNFNMIRMRNPNLIRTSLCCLYKGPQPFSCHIISHPLTFLRSFTGPMPPSSSSLQPTSHLSLGILPWSHREGGRHLKEWFQLLVPLALFLVLFVLKFVESQLQPLLDYFYSF